MGKNAWYGYVPDLPDHRDHQYPLTAVHLPDVVDLRAHCPPIMDQGALGSCTAHGITGALRYDRKKQSLPDQKLSRLQLYYDERVMEGTVLSDAGAMIRDGIKSASKIGVGHETFWPYKIGKFTDEPPSKCYASAGEDRALQYSRVSVDATAIRTALAQANVVVIGISVYESFEGDDVTETGIVPYPATSEQQVGGHCMYVCGYGVKPDHFLVANSWGNHWGDKGYCHIPYAYLGNPDLGSDYWVVTSIPGGKTA